MGVKIGQLIRLTTGDLNSFVIPGEYVLASSGTFTNLPTALNGRSVHLIVAYQTIDTTLIAQELRPAASGSQSIYRRTGSQSSGTTLHGAFTFNGWYSFAGTAL